MQRQGALLLKQRKCSKEKAPGRILTLYKTIMRHAQMQGTMFTERENQ